VVDHEDRPLEFPAADLGVVHVALFVFDLLGGKFTIISFMWRARSVKVACLLSLSSRRR
jgi:hypothetical protein